MVSTFGLARPGIWKWMWSIILVECGDGYNVYMHAYMSIIGLDKISCLFCFGFMLDKSTYFAFPVTHFAPILLSFLHTVSSN